MVAAESSGVFYAREGEEIPISWRVARQQRARRHNNLSSLCVRIIARSRM